MKKHPKRPALKASNIFRMIEKDKLIVEAIGTNGLISFRLVEYRHIYQSWLSRTANKTTKIHASTYLRKGLFLIPIWQKVPNWQIAYYEACKTDLIKESIYSFDGKYYRSCYMQVEDIDHAIRQQEHIEEKYASISTAFLSNNDIMNRITAILSHIKSRQKSLTAIKTQAKLTLNSHRRSLKSIINHSPLFVDHDTKNKTTIITIVRKIADSCRSYDLCFRPIFRRLNRAALSLECALRHIEHNHLKTAKKSIESALKNLIYPDPA